MHDVLSGRLKRYIRDLATLNALPAMCIGRTPDDALEIVVDALPNVLSCQLIHLTLQDGGLRASLYGAPVSGAALNDLTEALQRKPDDTGVLMLDTPERFWCLAIEVPIGSARGKLVAGKTSP